MGEEEEMDQVRLEVGQRMLSIGRGSRRVSMFSADSETIRNCLL
jgi:hypothetical protein